MTRLSLGFWAGASLLLAACGSSDKAASEDPVCGQARDKIQSCHLNATVNCGPSSDAEHLCSSHCVVKAVCDDLVSAATQGNPYFACLAQCAGLPADAFICADGSGAVAKGGVCDGRYQCGDGSDEANCTPSADAGTIADAGHD